MKVVTIPLNSDNYGYLLVDEVTKECAIVDVSNQPEKVLEEVAKHTVNLTMVLTTHKHWDHAGGNAVVLQRFPDVKILGSQVDKVEACNQFVSDGEIINFGNEITIKCLLTPGHTMGHISYFVEDGKTGQNVVFTGDCLFVGGAGKFFEGTGQDMYQSLYQKLGVLPPETLVYCGHEYTLSNYIFALSAEPENVRLVEENEQAKQLRAEGKQTIPTTIGKELLTNPFMRANESNLRQKYGGSDTATTLAAIRAAKDNF